MRTGNNINNVYNNRAAVDIAPRTAAAVAPIGTKNSTRPTVSTYTLDGALLLSTMISSVCRNECASICF